MSRQDDYTEAYNDGKNYAQDDMLALIDAAKGVIEHWEDSDLAAHVRHMSKVLAKLEPIYNTNGDV